MGQSWYYSRGSEQFGPVTVDELKELVRIGQVQADNLVWTEGMAQWAAVQAVPELAATVALPVQPPWQPQAQPVGVLGYQTPGIGPYEYAGFWLRFVAFIVDWIVTTIAGAIVGGVTGGIAAVGGVRPGSQQWVGVSVVIQIFTLVMCWLYYALMESSPKQATLGKMAVGIRVMDLDNARIGFGKATGRYFGKIISGIILLIGYMMAGWTEKKQALHDIMAGTLVVKGRA